MQARRPCTRSRRSASLPALSPPISTPQRSTVPDLRAISPPVLAFELFAQKSSECPRPFLPARVLAREP
eukprot:2159421-Pleurochrysis_carterae.AAC.1